jgi:hypothetical protein
MAVWIANGRFWWFLKNGSFIGISTFLTDFSGFGGGAADFAISRDGSDGG